MACSSNSLCAVVLPFIQDYPAQLPEATTNFPLPASVRSKQVGFFKAIEQILVDILPDLQTGDCLLAG